jgi:hypothetical protein
MHGMAMFGLSVISVLLVIILGGGAMGGGGAMAEGSSFTGGPHIPYMLTVFSDLGWVGFACLLSGWLAAIAGTAGGPIARAEASQDRSPRALRPAA